MLPQEMIAEKRDGRNVTPGQILEFINGIVQGSVSDAQIAAFAMAVVLNGMATEESVALTLAMRDTGKTLKWALDGPVIDKHSTGGIGDNVSLILAPALAACGASIPMISGRGLGHTGGTLDKLDAIPGYDTAPDFARFQEVVAETGCAIIGQTGELAPADSRIYAVRDVTATVESIPLITASILSKKLAAGLDALVLDVKFGSGAFMQTLDAARELATEMVHVGNGAGMKTSALLTGMDHPLAPCAGNGIEVLHAVRFLNGEINDNRLHRIVTGLGAELLKMGGLTTDPGEGRRMMKQALSSGLAAERFGKMIAAFGGPRDFVERPTAHLGKAPVTLEVVPGPLEFDVGAGIGFDTRHLGLAVVELGGGRRVAEDRIDYSVGLDAIAGADWRPGEPVCTVHANNMEAARLAEKRILAALKPRSSIADADIVERIAE